MRNIVTLLSVYLNWGCMSGNVRKISAPNDYKNKQDRYVWSIKRNGAVSKSIC